MVLFIKSDWVWINPIVVQNDRYYYLRGAYEQDQTDLADCVVKWLLWVEETIDSESTDRYVMNADRERELRWFLGSFYYSASTIFSDGRRVAAFYIIWFDDFL